MYEYRAFGEELKKLGSGDAKYTYGGKELDDETNLYYFNARYYDATIGRFINVDPIQDGLNWYVYCNNNPMNRADPTGLQDWKSINAMISDFPKAKSNNIYDLKSDLLEKQNYMSTGGGPTLASSKLAGVGGAVEMIAMFPSNIIKLTTQILQIANQDKIDKIESKMWDNYKKDFSNALDKIGKEKGAVSSEDLMNTILQTNQKYAEKNPEKVSIFDVKQPQVDIDDKSSVMGAVVGAGFKGYSIDVQNFDKKVSETNFIRQGKESNK